VQRDWAGQPEIGLRDTVSRWYYSSGTCWMISICSPGLIG